MNLAMFFSRKVSLEDWVKSGLFEREKLIYEEHLNKGHFENILWLTYGCSDNMLAEKLKKEGKLHPKIEVAEMPKLFKSHIGVMLYTILMPFVYRKKLSKFTIKKSNQMDGAWTAWIAKKLTGGMFSFRTGYTLTTFLEKGEAKSRIKIKIYTILEGFLYRTADVSFVSSEHDRDLMTKKYGLKGDRVKLLRNYIDIDLFNDTDSVEYIDSILFIGRLNKQKNLFNTIRAVTEAGFHLDIYGKGELCNELDTYIKQKHLSSSLRGYLPNDKLPGVINKYKYYIQASYYEGMPKSLLEAMACGRICIGTNVDGISEIIEDNKTGFLSPSTEVRDICDTIVRAKESENTVEISTRTRLFIEKNFSLSEIVSSEINTYRNLFL